MTRFGGRGHDFDCLDERANAEGGMLVVATSIPDAREWAQWRGRTARQDRPGQYLVVLSAEDEPFASEPGLAEARGHPKDDQVKKEDGPARQPWTLEEDAREQCEGHLDESGLCNAPGLSHSAIFPELHRMRG